MTRRPIRVLMLGWEYPPHISGGLGTACQGLTEALARLGLDIEFVVPRLYGDESAPHMQISEPETVRAVPVAPAAAAPGPVAAPAVAATGPALALPVATPRADQPSAVEPAAPGLDASPVLETTTETARIRRTVIESYLLPYLTPAGFEEVTEERVIRLTRPGGGQAAATTAPRGAAAGSNDAATVAAEVLANLPVEVSDILEAPMERAAGEPEHYGTDLFAEVGRYAGRVLQGFAGGEYDLIHAHDWLTYPAGLAVAEASGKPLIVHVHSLEFDRSGRNVDARINAIERAGITHADAVIAVSHYTRTLAQREHGVPGDRVAVVHNGVYAREVVDAYRTPEIPRGKVVLFLGRITFQKGPDYFVEAAARVIPHVPGVTFVIAGSGDMLPRMIERVAELGITKNFRFTGFLRGKEVERMFSMADLYVMPSVSEPFGISSLEALSYDTPVILSRQSGVSEVLAHAMKVDFWDVEQLANLIIGVLKYPQLREDIVGMAREEVKRLHWDAAAEKTLRVYQRVLGRAAAVTTGGAVSIRQGVP